MQAAQAADKEHAYFGMLPLENDAAGEATALATMLLCFAWIYVGPLLTNAALVAAVVYHSKLAAAWLATIAFLAFAPVKPDCGGWGRAYIWQTWRRWTFADSGQLNRIWLPQDASRRTWFRTCTA